ncbi:MAG TPA: M20/M25/M40 family metallo-hydrolase [Vicinamibacterales bacterium]|nr:M20/M25/M40 family metallo-hydrolase [Vicinamibacterales bacterium]
MRLWRQTTLAFVLATIGLSAQRSDGWLDPYRPIAQKLIAESQSSDAAWRRLAELTDTFGHRLSGSESLEKAIDWAVNTMKTDGLENVRKEPVMVPKWVRGHESLDLVEPIRQSLTLLGLGNSVGTPPTGIEADVIVVRDFDDLTTRAASVKGRMVLFNVPFTNYGTTVAYRAGGPSRAAALGAVAVLVRSVGPPGLRTPHTGATRYEASAPQIPAAAVTTEDADRFQRLQDRNVRIRVKLMMEAHFEPDSQSYNVVGELRGRELPQEIVLVGGHFDSWDVGAGASDDGGGCVATWEALRLMKKLGLRPRRTVRVVLFTNEENGGRGGAGYRDAHQAELANHVVLLESDGGVFDPAGFGFTGPDSARRTVTAIGGLLKPLGADPILASGGGADIEPSGRAANLPMMSHVVSGEYFLIHHTPADTIARITPKQIADNAAAIAVMAYVVADLPWKLGSEQR